VASPPTANEITTQIASLLTSVIGTSGTKKAKILDYLPLAFLVTDHEDTTALQSPLDTVGLTNGTRQRINCLLVSAAPGFSQSVAPATQRDATRHVRDARGRNVVTRRLALIYLYEFGEGSEATFNTNVELIRNTLNQNQKLGFPVVTAGLAGQGESIEGHDGWQVLSGWPQPFPGTIVHVADGTLTVRVVEPL
jgi:hypothetical protein